MSNRLTREQVGERLRIIAATMPSTGTDRIKAAAEIMNNDAALRARITELESMTLIERSQHLDTLTAEVERLQQRNTEIQTSLSIATERIVQVEEERDEANDSFASNMLIMWTKVKEVFPHVENYEQFWGELATLQSHLTQAQADLQEALRCKNWGEIYDWHEKRHRKLVELTDQLTQAQEERQREHDKFVRVNNELETSLERETRLKDPHSPDSQAVIERWLIAFAQGEAKPGDCQGILRRFIDEAVRPVEERERTLREALEYIADEKNWSVEEDASYQMKRPGGSQHVGIFLSSHFLNPWVFAYAALQAPAPPGVAPTPPPGL